MSMPSACAGAMGALPQGRYMWGSVQTVRGCPTLFVLLGVAHRRMKPRQRRIDSVVARLSSSDVMGSGSSRLPTTTSIPSR